MQVELQPVLNVPKAKLVKQPNQSIAPPVL